MTRRSTGRYPDDWPEIARSVKGAAGWRCVRCGHPHDPATGHTLTVHHADIDPSNCRWWNLLALCQRCHLRVQAKVYLDRPWLMLEHSAWFRPYVGGWYAWKYLGRDVTRAEVEADLAWFVGIERRALGLSGGDDR
jgi:hypothetical protein